MLDFHDERLSRFDVGCYETDGLASNPGWETNPLPPTTPTNLQLR